MLLESVLVFKIWCRQGGIAPKYAYHIDLPVNVGIASEMDADHSHMLLVVRNEPPVRVAAHGFELAVGKCNHCSVRCDDTT